MTTRRIAQLEAVIADQRADMRKLRDAISRWQTEHDANLAALRAATDSDGTILELIEVLRLDVECEHEKAQEAEQKLEELRSRVAAAIEK